MTALAVSAMMTLAMPFASFAASRSCQTGFRLGNNCGYTTGKMCIRDRSRCVAKFPDRMTADDLSCQRYDRDSRYLTDIRNGSGGTRVDLDDKYTFVIYNKQMCIRDRNLSLAPLSSIKKRPVSFKISSLYPFDLIYR